MKRFYSYKKIAIAMIFFMTLFVAQAPANNLALSNVGVVSQSTSADTVTFQFDISWDNSWSDSINKDAAWIFVKYSTDSGTTWNHATMKTAGTNPSGTSQGSGTGIDLVVSQDKKGCFIQRSSQGSGTLSTTSIQIVWNYAADGISDAAAVAQSTTFKFFGIEMTYIPTGSFYIGDGNNGTIGEFQWEASVPGSIDSETNSLQFEAAANVDSAFYYSTDTGSANDDATGAIFTIGGSFPKGYAAFYLMKYEITQGQWVEFFNTLTTAQKTNRDITSNDATQLGKNSDAVVNRNTVAWTSGDATYTRSDRACNYISWQDQCAYLDWVALRPYTELEFEKACRGPFYPLINEYPWGTTTITAAKTISGTEDGTETITTSGVNANYNNTTFTGAGSDVSTGPLRAGIFATASTVTRGASGSGYYGNMDLAGSLWERPVTVGNSAGRSFAGTHGDGVLTSVSTFEGNATNLDWPGISSTNSQGVTISIGSGFRGGAWNVSTASDLQTSNRHWAGDDNDTRTSVSGGRGARTASA